MNKKERKKLAQGVKLYNKCSVCYTEFEPTDKGQYFDPMCKTCLEKKNNRDKFAGYCDRGHPLVFHCMVYPNRFEPYCKTCQVFVISKRSVNGKFVMPNMPDNLGT